MANKAGSTSPLGKGLDFALSLLEEADVTVDAECKNLRPGPIDLHAVHANNQNDVTATEVFVKVYDDISEQFVAGVSKPVLMFPVSAYAGGAEPGGMATWMCVEGYPLRNGLSMLCAKDNGNTATNAPDQFVDIMAATT